MKLSETLKKAKRKFLREKAHRDEAKAKERQKHAMRTAMKMELARGGMAMLLILIGLLFTGSAFAGGHCRVVQQVVAHHQAYVAPVAINYFVGQPIRAEAIVEKALRDDPDYELFKKFKSWKNTSNGRPAMEPATNPAEVAQPNAPENAVPILYQHCGGCHSGATPKAGLLLDGSAPIDCKTLVKCIDEITAGTMPKAKPNESKPELTDADEDAVIAALSRLVKQP